MKRFLAVIFTVLLSAGCVFAAMGAEAGQRVYDNAGLFSSEETAELEKELDETVDETGLDFIVLTTSDKDGASLQDYADDFYDQGGFGTDDEYSGLLLLIDMEDRTVYISTAGKAIKYLTDDRLLDLTDHNDRLYGKLSAGDYKGAAENVIDGVREFVREGIPGAPKLTVIEVLLALLIPALTAFLYVRSIKRQYAMTAEKNHSIQYALAYRAASNYVFAESTDDLTDHHVSFRVIPRTSSSHGSGSGHSTTHMSHGGRTHGGGGGGRHF